MKNEHEEPDYRGPAIIVRGSIASGFEFVGPFESIEAANTFHKTTFQGTLGAPVTIALLTPPDKSSGSPK